MRVLQNRKHLFAFCMLGFFAGILYANLITKQYATMTGIFNEYFLNQYLQTEIVIEDYAWYILGIRVVPLLILILLGSTKLRKVAIYGTLLWTGFSFGMLLTTSIIRLGMKGIFLCVIGITPQFLFYSFSYIVILWYFYHFPHARWNTAKTIFVTLVFSIGLVMESYVNPILMQMFVRTMM